MDKYYIPKLLDEPFRIYLLTLDEFFVLLIPILLIGFILNQIILGFILGVGGLALLKKFKGEQGHFYLVHMMYWHLPQFVRFKATPASYVREYLG